MLNLKKILVFLMVLSVFVGFNACSTYFDAEKVHFERNVSSEVLK